MEAHLSPLTFEGRWEKVYAKGYGPKRYQLAKCKVLLCIVYGDWKERSEGSGNLLCAVDVEMRRDRSVDGQLSSFQILTCILKAKGTFFFL